MNIVEIEQAVSELFQQPFDAAQFAYQFLAAFGHKETALRRLRAGNSNSSDVANGVLLRNHIHLATCAPGQTGATLMALRKSPATNQAKAKLKFLLATDGQTLQAEDLSSGEILPCDYADLPNHFGFLLSLAGIYPVQEIKNNPIDVRATRRVNQLYLELLRANPQWVGDARRADMNHFMACLIFCFFAEDTDIFNGNGLFTQTLQQMSQVDGSNAHEVLSEIFRAMNTPYAKRDAARLRHWAAKFPYVNGGLFAGSTLVPHFSRMARIYLLSIGDLSWREISPDIFGSMIQAIADDQERSTLGMHYTSVPNILKLLNPLFLDDLRADLEAAADNKRKLLNLRKRMAHIRVFDPACGSGNFLVIAYREMRKIEVEINQRRGEPGLASAIALTNFRGIELRHFPAEIARLALIIAEFQCDVLYRGQKEALADFLPLEAENWIIHGNALRLDWLSVCPPSGSSVKLLADDLFSTPLHQAEIDFENEGGETYICSNPPYRGSKLQTGEQKSDLSNAWGKHAKLAKTTDFVTGWFARFFDYADKVPGAVSAFVATNSVCQGQQAGDIWSVAFERGCEIRFAHASFKWTNLASNNAGVTVVVIGLGKKSSLVKKLYGDESLKQCSAIGPYLVPDSLIFVQKTNQPMGQQSIMLFGNMPRDGGHLVFDAFLAEKVMAQDEKMRPFVKRFVGADELINGRQRYCLWIADEVAAIAKTSNFIAQRLKLVEQNRNQSNAESTRQFARQPHRFVQIAGFAKEKTIIVPSVSSENRDYLPVGLLDNRSIVSNAAFALYDAPLWNMALIASRLHLVWIATVCGKLETRYRYSNTLGWNTFPLPLLTEQNQLDLTRCAEDILLAREEHFPASIADLYDPDNMPDNLRQAHARNDETLERIYIGRKFKNDAERLEKLFCLYSKMMAQAANSVIPQKKP